MSNDLRRIIATLVVFMPMTYFICPSMSQAQANETIVITDQPDFTRVREGIRKALDKGDILLGGALQVNAIESYIQQEAHRQNAKIIGNPDGVTIRRRLSREILGKELYEEIETQAILSIPSAFKPRRIYVACDFLGRGLSSDRAISTVHTLLEDL